MGAYVSAQRPNCLCSPATCSPFSTSTSHHRPSIGPGFSFTYSFKSKMPTEIQYGVEVGGASGPSAGVKNTAKTRSRGGGGEPRKKYGGSPNCVKDRTSNVVPVIFFFSSCPSFSFSICHFSLQSFCSLFSLFFLIDALPTEALRCRSNWDVQSV